MTLEEIKSAVESGKKVYWSSKNYIIIKDSIGQWLVHSQFNNHYWGLTHMDGVTVNGKPEDFFVEEIKMNKFMDVHDSHCCKIHGCKYRDENCTVANGTYEGITCEDCEYDEIFSQKWIDKEKLLEQLQELISEEHRQSDINSGKTHAKHFWRHNALKQVKLIVEKFQSRSN